MCRTHNFCVTTEDFRYEGACLYDFKPQRYSLILWCNDIFWGLLMPLILLIRHLTKAYIHDIVFRCERVSVEKTYICKDTSRTLQNSHMI